MNRKLFFLFITFSFVLNCGVLGQNCGIERWKIKTLSDADTAEIDFSNIKGSSVHEQVNLLRPFGKINARQPSEEEVYQIECFIIGFVKEKDHDIHIKVKDVNTDETMVIELVNPDCFDAKNSSHYHQFQEVYESFINNMGAPHSTFKLLDTPTLISITGVGFWDFLHGQKGMAKNGREIHPVLSMIFPDSVSTIKPEVNINKRNDSNNKTNASGLRTGCICKDGTKSKAMGSGACSGHGGVRNWLYK